MRKISADPLAQPICHAVTLLQHCALELAGHLPQTVELDGAELAEILQAVHDLGYILMIVLFLLFVRDIDGDEVAVFGVVHFVDLMLVGALGFGLVVMRLGLLPPGLDFLTDGVVLGLDFA